MFMSDARKNSHTEFRPAPGKITTATAPTVTAPSVSLSALRCQFPWTIHSTTLPCLPGITVVDLLILSPKFDFTLSASSAGQPTSQYNNQISNVNSHARLQWRCKPVSDLFIVILTIISRKPTRMESISTWPAQIAGPWC